MKRYRKPKVKDNQMILQRGKVDGIVDEYIFYGCKIPKCDRDLLFYFICFDNHNYSGREIPSLIKELENRGYDLDTLKFSIEKSEERITNETSRHNEL